MSALRAQGLLPYDLRRTIVVTGSPRSGTTWLAELLATTPGSGVLFEPDNLRHVAEAADAGMSWRTDIQPGADWPEGRRYLERVLRGRVLNLWTTRELERWIRPRTWIVKFVRANRMLAWLTTEFDLPRAVLIIRHPCAVVSSQVARGWPANPGWNEEEPFLRRNPHLRSVLATVRTPEEILAARWAIDAAVPLQATEPRRWSLLTFEELAIDPIGVMTRLFGSWGMPVPPQLSSVAGRWSSTARETQDRDRTDVLTEWQRLLRPETADRILEIAHAFGIDAYGPEPHPDPARLR